MVKQEKLLSYYPFLAHLQEFIFVSRSFPDRPLSSGGSGGETPTYLAFNLVSLKHKCKKLFLSLSQLQTKKPNMYLFRKLLLHYLLNAISYQISKCKVPKFRNVFFSSQMSCKIAKISKKVWICVFRKSFFFF